MGSGTRTALAVLATFILFYGAISLLSGVFNLVDYQELSMEFIVGLVIVVGCLAAIGILRGTGFVIGACGACAIPIGVLYFLQGSPGSIANVLGIALILIGAGVMVYGRRYNSRTGAVGTKKTEPKEGLQGVVRRLTEDRGILSFWLQSQNGEQIPIEAYPGRETIREGDTVWLRGGRGSDGVLRASEIRNVRGPAPLGESPVVQPPKGTDMSGSGQDSTWLQSQKAPQEIPKFEKSKKDDTVIGTARMVRIQKQEKKKKSAFEKWAVQGEKSMTVQRFRIEITDQGGNILEVVPVEVWAKEIHGEIADGDNVHVEGKKEHGVLMAKRVYNKTTNSELRIRK